MTARRLLYGFQERTPWPTMRIILKINELPVGRGWGDTTHRLLDLLENNPKEYTRKFSSLKVSFENYLLAGEKAVKAFRFDIPDISELIGSFSKLSLQESFYQQDFPLPIEDDKLRKIDYKTKLVKVVKKHQKTFLVACTKRHFDERIALDPKVIDEKVKETIGGFDEIEELIAVKKKLKQCFDILVIHETTGIIELRVDVGLGMKTKDREQIFEQIISFFNSIFESLGSPLRLNDPINFFPAVKALYQSEEGRVCELYFTTDEGSLKYEKMRRRDIDLRKETYHKAGREAVEKSTSPIASYRIAVIWDFPVQEDIQSEPELLLPGKITALSDFSYKLEELLIKKSCGILDYDFLIQKAIKYSG